MPWTRPDFQEITLNMEVTGYVNTDDDVVTVERVANLPAASEKAGRQPDPREDLA